MYENSKGELVSVSYDELQNLYNNNEILADRKNSLNSAEYVNAKDDDGNEMVGIRTKWESSESEKYFSITSKIYSTRNNNGNPVYVLGDSKTMGSTFTCSCEGVCSNGCDAFVTGTSFCSCSPCFPSGNCNKKSTLVVVIEYSFT